MNSALLYFVGYMYVCSAVVLALGATFWWMDRKNKEN